MSYRSKFYCPIVFLLMALTNNVLAQSAYLDEVLKIIEQHALHKDSVDFTKIRSNAFAQLRDAKSISDCYPVIRSVLFELKDRHSFLMEKADVDQWKSTSKSGLIHSEAFNGKIIMNDIGLIEMLGFSSGDSVSVSGYANDMQKLIESLDNKKIRGWIIDLRQNTGGNCWPMLAGLGPLLGNGVCGYFVNNTQRKLGWHYNDGNSGDDSVVYCRINRKPYQLINKNISIAVLTGDHTASSGEVVATAFRGKRNAKSFGMNTSGFSTGNANYPLSDGSMLFLTTSVYADRTGISYGGKIQPDHFVQFGYDNIGTENDQVIKQAVDWIKVRK